MASFPLLPLTHGWAEPDMKTVISTLYRCYGDVVKRQEPWVFSRKNFKGDLVSLDVPFEQRSRMKQEAQEINDDYCYLLNGDVLYYSLRGRKTLEIPNSFLNVPAQLIFPAIVY